ncbi:MAG: ribbon-helix-helix protein, CopG family [Aquificae bacterium]|nr:ribbon-helix-helix protein, CopG family [Aquificota bacterium]
MVKERKSKDIFAVRIDKDLVKEFKKLAIEQDKKYGELLEEAIKDLLEKYKKKEK